eukprot:6193551-Alexandrium_andersonii.AAC.1
MCIRDSTQQGNHAPAHPRRNTPTKKHTHAPKHPSTHTTHTHNTHTFPGPSDDGRKRCSELQAGSPRKSLRNGCGRRES